MQGSNFTGEMMNTVMKPPETAPITIAELGAAIGDDRLDLLYQPQMTANGETMAAVEALIRMRGPRGEHISPGRFVHVAEGSGLIVQLGAWILRRACRDGAKWPGLTVSVNVSPMQFHEPDFVEFVEATARAAGMPLDRLELEITESAYFDDIDSAEIEIRRLRALGIRIALDDFGTGYASLTYVRRLPLSKIKIDKSFVDEFDQIGSAAIIQAVVAMSRALGLKVTAEGVESIAQQRFLKAAGCHYLQGYLFSKPLTADEIAARLVAARPVPRA